MASFMNSDLIVIPDSTDQQNLSLSSNFAAERRVLLIHIVNSNLKTIVANNCDTIHWDSC
jgi:hypothetical protein